MTELFAADTAARSGACADVSMTSTMPSRKKGEPDSTKSWSCHSVKHQKNAFVRVPLLPAPPPPPHPPHPPNSPRCPP
jgi:hypothetical protein